MGPSIQLSGIFLRPRHLIGIYVPILAVLYFFPFFMSNNGGNCYKSFSNALKLNS